MMKKNYFDKLNAGKNRIDEAGSATNVTEIVLLVKKALPGEGVGVSL